MRVELKNFILNDVINMFFDMPLKGKHSRHRTRFIQLLENQNNEVAEEQKILIKEHCRLDEEGNPKTRTIDGEEIYDVKDIEKLNFDRTELLNESLVISGEGKEDLLLTIREILDDCQVEFKEAEANLYNHLCDTFKVDEDISEM